MDKKSLIGLGLIAAILGVWLYFSGPTKEQIARNKQIKDSLDLVEKNFVTAEAAKLAAAQSTATTQQDTSVRQTAAVASDSAKAAVLRDTYKDFATASTGTAQTFVIENENVRATISNKGAVIEKVELKKYHRPGQTESLVLFDKDSTRFALKLNVYNNMQLPTDNFYFKSVKQTPSSIVLRLETDKPGSYIEYSYTLKAADYIVDAADPADDDDSRSNALKEKQAATIYFKQDINSPDYINPAKDEEKELSDADIKWVCFKQQFFNSTIIADKVFSKAGSFIKSSQRPESETIVKAAFSEPDYPYGHTPNEKFAFKFYFGPNHYNTLKTYDYKLEQIIPTGWSIFSYINKWMVIPLFDWLSFLNVGIVILILTIIVKIVLLPIAYKTYMSGARMRVLKPETDALNAKFEKNADPMKKQQEQMALYRKAGVNPLSGCLPLLLQFPILIALFNFMPAAIELRQHGFLWADDLSTYDSIWTFGNVPFISWAYGDHVSLFAALMFVSTIIYTYMNSSMMPQQNNAQMPGMKFMMYFMPVIFLAVMNEYAAGLSWYYFLANMFTFLQNFIIKKIVSDDKIRAQLEANMKKPAKVSNFQKRLEEMAKQRQQLPAKPAKKK